MRHLFEFCWLWIIPGVVSRNFFVRGYLPLIQKDSSIHMCGLAVYVKEGLSFARDLSVENFADSYVFDWLYFFQCLILVPLSITFAFVHVFDSISSNMDESSKMDEILSINPSANVFVFGDFNVHHEDWLLMELIDLVNSVIIFLSQTTSLRWFNFLLGSQAVILTVLLFWIYLFLLRLVFVPSIG